MGVFNRKGTVRDGLVLELDAANQKSWGADQTKWKDTTSQGNDGTLTNGPVHSQGPFPGAGYVDFDGTGDNIYAANSSDFDFGSGDFTLEMWILSRNVGITAVPFGKRNNTSTYAPIIAVHESNANLTIYLSSNGTSWSMSGGAGITIGTMVVNKWHHVAIVRNGNIITGYFDGVGTQIANTSSAFTTNTHNFNIGGDATTNYLNGSVSNFRIVKGTALYTSNFTPHVSELTAVPNTKLLTCQKGTITDTSVSGHSITVTGNAAAVYNDSSHFTFDGSNDYVSFASASELQFLNILPYTLESWMYPTSNPGSSKWVGIFNREDSSGGSRDGYNLWINGPTSNTLNLSSERFYSGTATAVGYTFNNSDLLNKWHHIVVTYDGTTLKLYRNGEQLDSSSSTGNITNTSKTLEIGRRITHYFTGRLSTQRIYNQAFTSTEITQNFNALRARFGI